MVFGGTYGNLKIHQLVRKGRHLVVEAESEFANVIRREDEIALSLFLALHDDTLARTDNRVVNIEGTARLDLYFNLVSTCNRFESTCSLLVALFIIMRLKRSNQYILAVKTGGVSTSAPPLHTIPFST
jgi:hypothetical protein